MTKTGFLLKIKAGDRVWVGNHRNPRRFLKLVERISPTQIILNWNGEGYLRRFKREGGFEKSGSWNPDLITGIATPRECDQFDAAEKKAQEAAQADREAKEAQAVFRLQLASLVGENAEVSEERYTGLKGFTLTIHGMSANDIRWIATVMNKE